MRRAANKVQDAVNEEVQRRIKTHYTDGKKLRFQSPRPWVPNAAFVNCYDGGTERFVARFYSEISDSNLLISGIALGITLTSLHILVHEQSSEASLSV
jgi:hypothetical protein